MRSLRSPLAALGFVGVLVSVPVFAQSGGDYPMGCDESKVSRGDHERAHTVFLSGKQFLEESNYDKAISYFKDAYSIDCSVHAMLPIIATAYERKGDRAEAIRALGEYLKRAPTAPDHEVVEHRIRNLRDQLAREQPPLVATSAPPAPAPVPAPAPLPAVAPPLTAVPPASEPPMAAPPGPRAPAPEPQAESSGPGPAPWVLVGVGGAAVVAGVIVFVIGAGDVSSAVNACNPVPPNNRCQGPPGGPVPNQTQVDSYTKKQSDGYSLENAGGVVGAVGAAAVGVGVIWGLVGANHSTTTASVTPVLAPGYGGISVGGRF